MARDQASSDWHADPMRSDAPIASFTLLPMVGNAVPPMPMSPAVDPMVPMPAWAAERLLALGDRLSGDHPVVAHEDGRPVNPMVLTAWCRRRFGKLHGLRHTHASQLLGAGVNVKALSRRLGHSAAALTLSTYAPACCPELTKMPHNGSTIYCRVANG
jgi:Phage integrase family